MILCHQDYGMAGVLCSIVVAVIVKLDAARGLISDLSDAADANHHLSGWPAVLQQSGHPYHRVQPAMLCKQSDAFGGALDDEQVDGPVGAPLASCAWKLGADLQKHTNENFSGMEPPNAGRRWVFYDVFARDRQLFAVVPQFRRMSIRVEELKARVRSSRNGSSWHRLFHRDISPSMPKDQFPHNAWDVHRWRLPNDVGIDQFMVVSIEYAGDIHIRRIWHADVLGSQLRSVQGHLHLRRRQNDAPAALAFDKNAQCEAPIECITHPGWYCLWPRLQHQRLNSGGPTASGLPLEPESQPQPEAYVEEMTSVDPRPYRLMATTMMLLEDKEKYMASWAAFHADRGVEAVVAYRNDDEWLQGACLTVQAIQFYCEGIQLDDARQTVVDPTADFEPGSSVRLCAAPPRLRPGTASQCMKHVHVSNQQNPTVLELSWPFRKYNHHLEQSGLYEHEAQPHSMMHFLFKYGKPLAEWMINMDVDEYINVTSFDRLIRDADSNAVAKGKPLPGSIYFWNRFTVASLKPVVASQFKQCPPQDLLMNPGAPMYQDMRQVGYTAMNQPFVLAGMPRQALLSVDTFRMHGLAATRDRQLSLRSSLPLRVQQARHLAWWKKDALPHRYWPLFTASPIDKSRLHWFDRTIRSKWMVRTDLAQTLMIHRVKLVTHPAPAVRQWSAFAGRSQAGCRSNGSTNLLGRPSAHLQRELHAAIAGSGAAEGPASVFADDVHTGACMLHLMEQTFVPKLFQADTASLLPDGEYTPSDCVTSVAAADGFGPLPARSDGNSSCEREVRQALFLRGYCQGRIEEYKARGRYNHLPPFEQPGQAEEVTWAVATGAIDPV